MNQAIIAMNRLYSVMSTCRNKHVMEIPAERSALGVPTNSDVPEGMGQIDLFTTGHPNSLNHEMVISPHIPSIWAQLH